MYEKARAAGLSPKSVRHVHGLLHASLEWAVKMNLCLRNAATIAAGELPKLEKSPARALTEDEVKRLLETAKRTPWYGLFTLALCTGARRGELAALQWANIDFERKEMAVEKSLARGGKGIQVLKDPKTGKSRIIPLNRLALSALEWHRARQSRDRKRAGELYIDNDHVFR
jgi:integrase